MARRKKPVYEFELDDEELDEETRELIVDKYMEDISEILSQAYTDVDVKVRALVEALKEDDE